MMPILREAINRAGGMTQFASAIGLSRSAVYQWSTRIPAERVMDVEAASGIPRSRLRPDLFRGDDRKKGAGKKKRGR